VVSGGHTQLILMKGIGEYKILGETRDDAAGECFDKTAKILGLDYPGGPVISTIAGKSKKEDRKTGINLPRPMLNQKNYDFSFSGLKTAVLYNFKNTSKPIRTSKEYINEMCYEIQQAIIDVLVAKTIRASKEYNVKTIILGGGVASNKELRKQLGKAIKQQLPKANYLKPAIKLCSDNAVMVGMVAIISQMFLRSLWFGGGRSSNDKSGAIFMIIGILLAILAPIVVMLVQMSISRKREFAADASAVKFTRNPQGLIGALEKIKTDNAPSEKKVSKAIAPLFFSNPFKNVGNTHPPLEKRIAVLKSM